MSKKVKPCVQCGSTERYPARGRIGPCKPCALKKSKRRAAKDRQLDEDSKGYHSKRLENMLNIEWRIRHLWSCAKNRAQKKDRVFDISFEQAWEVFKSQDGRCAVSGREFDLIYQEGGPNPNGPSFDRIDSSLGYTLDNVRFVTYHVNTALSSFGDEALISLCKDILENK